MCIKLTTHQTLLALVVLAAVLSASGFVLEYGFNVIPCEMCWWQRYAHYAVLAAAAVGFAAPRTAKIALSAVIAAALVGLSIAAWQFAAQHGWLPFPPTCTSDPSQTFAAAEDLLAAMNTTKIVPCDKETFTLLGLSLAGWNIPAMLTVLALSAKALFRRA